MHWMISGGLIRLSLIGLRGKYHGSAFNQIPCGSRSDSLIRMRQFIVFV